VCVCVDVESIFVHCISKKGCFRLCLQALCNERDFLKYPVKRLFIAK